MALQSSGQISLSDIAVEFGGTAPHSMSEYYGSDTVPSSGAISIGDFYGTSNAVFMAATGGTVTTSGDYKIHKFTGSGTFTVSVAGNAAGSNTIEYLIVAGGGSGGSGGTTGGLNLSGGGGAGGFRTSTITATTGAKTITVGGGSSDSSALGITSTGGGSGGSSAPGTSNPGGSGGSGGGGGFYFYQPYSGPWVYGGKAGGSGISGQGFAGKAGDTSGFCAGGGGGAGRDGVVWRGCVRPVALVCAAARCEQRKGHESHDAPPPVELCQPTRPTLGCLLRASGIGLQRRCQCPRDGGDPLHGSSARRKPRYPNR